VLLLYAGRLSPEKNVTVFIAMLRDLVRDPHVDYRLVLAGDGPCAAWLRQQATGDLEGRILLCGSLDRDALADWCASGDVFVHPNPREPFGIGPLEAMASGVPVVVPAAGGVLEYASRENAWLAEPTSASLASAIRPHAWVMRLVFPRRSEPRIASRGAGPPSGKLDLYDGLFAEFTELESTTRGNPLRCSRTRHRPESVAH
jgi:hypothetical protein